MDITCNTLIEILKHVITYVRHSILIIDSLYNVYDIFVKVLHVPISTYTTTYHSVPLTPGKRLRTVTRKPDLPFLVLPGPNISNIWTPG